MLQLAIRRAGNCISRQYRQIAQQRVAHRLVCSYVVDHHHPSSTSPTPRTGLQPEQWLS